MATQARPAMDPNDGVALRSYYESLRATLESDRSSQLPQWQQLEAFFAPGTARWDPTDANNGQRKDQSIINETGLLALRTLRSGMLTGMSSPTRPWVKVRADLDDLDEQADVRQWCEESQQRVHRVFRKSNAYQSLLTLYGEEGLYGTSAFLVLEDDKTVIRCHPYPIGSYALGLDDSLRVDLSTRVVTMTARQIVERFGRENTSNEVLTIYDSNAGGQKEQRFPVVHVLHKGSYFGPGVMKPPPGISAKSAWWSSVWYEQASYKADVGILRRSGFLENPLMAGRWSVVGEDTWGKSAAMDCLGSCMSLQAWEERLAMGTEKHLDPPMVADAAQDPRKLSVLPGDVSFVDFKDGKSLFAPAYQVDFKLEGGLNQIQRIEARINDAMYRSLFQMFSESDRKEITAEEIRARAAEKMQVLGPVVERNVEEVLAPLVMRTISIMERRGLLPKMPDSMKGRPIRIEFESILAQAQQIGSVNNITQFLAIVGNEVAVDQGILDNVDLDVAAQETAKLLGVPSKIIRTPDQVAAIRQDRARQQQLAAAAENAQKLAAAAENMSNTQTGTGSLLDQLPGLAGGV